MKDPRFIEACKADGQKIERLIRRFYSQQARRRVFVDGGAHHGYHTSYARQFFTDAVIAIEASPKTFVEHLNRQRSMSVEGGACLEIPLNVALGNRARQGDTIEFFFSEEHPGRSTVNSKIWDTWSKGAVRYEAPIQTAVFEIDDCKDYLTQGATIDFIKLDLEGNEVAALRGGLRTLKEDRPNIVMEFGLKPSNEAEYGESLDGFRQFLAEMGYRAIAPWGDDVTDSMVAGYPFWYVFLLPQGASFDANLTLLKASYDASLAET
ncbi:MAG: FkbM family methyltransferase [Pseudomonadota bacterium]